MHRLPRLLNPRRIASVMLLVWLSGMFASWAHACLVTAPGASAHAGAHHAPPADHALAGDAVVDVAGDTSLPLDAALALCEDFCETERSTIPKAQATKVPSDTNPLMMRIATIGAAPAALALRQAEPRWHPLAESPPPGPPVSIVFLRLTR